MKIEIRPQKLSDAKRFYEILSNPHYKYISTKPETIEDEKEYLRLNNEKRKNNSEFNFSILWEGYLVGGIGIRVDPFRSHIGEIGFFIDKEFWRKGIASQALKKLEYFISSNLNVIRLELRMAKENKASQKIAIEAGYEKEGVLRKMLKVNDQCYDCYLYSKIIIPD